MLVFAILLAGATSVRAQDKGLTVSERMVTEARVALVIGNANYEHSPLRNPVNDARAMAVTLKSLGFEVTSACDQTQKQMKRAILDFGKALKRGGVGLFYYSGHAVQVGGNNYLMPINAMIESEVDVDIEGVRVDAVLARMESAGNRLNIVILDACRNNPFATQFKSLDRGLSVMNAPSGTLVAYATAPGSVARDGEGENGIYTAQLIKHISQPGLTIEQVFKKVRTAVKESTGGEQIPWESTALEGDFYFNLSQGVPAGAGDIKTGPIPGQTDVVVNDVRELQGTWTDPSTGMMWQDPAAAEVMFWGDAREYCFNLELAGFDDWRLPDVSELRSLLRGCSATVTGGSCTIAGNQCLSISCWADSCQGCSEGNGLGSDGWYLPEGAEGEGGTYWSSSEVADQDFEAWAVNFIWAAVLRIETRNAYIGGAHVRCVR